jgi:PAS domain S-box-containing protein
METDPAAHSSRVPVLILVLLITGIGVTGSLYVAAQHRAFDDAFRRELAAAADMKALQVADWCKERVADAAVLAADIRLMPALQRVLRGQASRQEEQQANAWIDSVRTHYRYGAVILTGTRGEVRLSTGRLYGSPEHYRLLTHEASIAPDLVIHDIHSEHDGRETHFGMNVALTGAEGEPLGALLLGIDPVAFLYPALRDWPGAGRTGEILLVRRDGDSVSYLNDSRLRPGFAMKIREPISLTTSPAVRAVLGATGEFDGTDYRGQVVIAASQPIPGSHWFLVAKVDRSEALAPENRNTILLVTLMVALGLASGAVVALLFRRQSARFYRKQYEAEMERKVLRGHYDFLTRYANDAILLADEDGRIIEVNDRAAEIFGYSREELLRMKLADLKPAELAGELRATSQALREKKSSVFETTNQRKDGSLFPAEISARWIEEEGRCYQQSIIRDISERKQAERQIARLNHLYAVLSRCGAAIIRARSENELFGELCRIAVESGSFRIAWAGSVDPATSLVVPVATAGDAAAYLDEVKISAAEGPLGAGPIGTCIREGRAVAINNIDTDASMAPWREAAARHGLRSCICLPLQRRGQTVCVVGWYSSEADFFRGEETALAVEVGASMSYALDRMDLERERVRADLERQQSQERLELALDAANEGYWDWKITANEWYASPRYHTILGYQPGEREISLESARQMMHPDDLPSFDKALAELQHPGCDSTSIEYRVRHKDGHYIWVLTRAKVVARDASGHPARMVGTRSEITGRKRLEEQFLQAQKLESVGRLAGGVAHDFNNHLTVINGYADLLRKQLPAGSPIAESLAEIQQAGERAAALTRQLLAFSRKQIASPERLNLNTVITGMQKMIRRLMGEDVELQLELAPDLGSVLADATQIEQVVMNLAINARDAVQSGGRVIIKTGQEALTGEGLQADRTGPHVRLTVTDNGSGMTPEVRQHIFEPFYTTKDTSRGTGLGLSTVYGIVQGNGGFIIVDSEPGKGSSFHIYFPCAGEPAGAARTEQHPARPLEGSETILVVEDQEEVRRLAVDILEHYGYRVIAAANGDEALALAGKHEGVIDLVVSDMVMPGMSGTELIRHLVRSRPRVKVLYVSGYTADSIRQQELAAGAAAFLPKPYSPDGLANKVRELLSGNAVSSTPREGPEERPPGAC